MQFDFEVPVSFFEKAGAEKGKQRRIGGIVSTESPDRQGEIVLQRGLDFESNFLQNGWFNDNHSKKTADILGYPEAVQRFKKGQTLPDGNKARTNGTWVEGYLLDTPQAEEIWKLGRSLQKTKRRLGFSVEGSIQKREGPKTVFVKSRDGKGGQWVGNRVAKAVVRNVAITNCPVNTDSRLEILGKSLQAIESADEDMLKALGMGPPPPAQPAGPQTGIGAGHVLSPESLEEKRRKKEEKAKQLEKALADERAMTLVRKKLPGASLEQAARIVELTKKLKTQGRL